MAGREGIEMFVFPRSVFFKHVARGLAWFVASLGVAFGSLLWFGVFHWWTAYRFPSPNSDSEIRIDVRKCFADCEVLPALAPTAGRTHTLFTRSDCDIRFVHVYWNNHVVGVFADDALCGGARFAYNVKAGRELPFDQIERAFDESIVREYKLTQEELGEAGGDLLAWIASKRNRRSFRLHDEFRQRYGR